MQLQEAVASFVYKSAYADQRRSLLLGAAHALYRVYNFDATGSHLVRLSCANGRWCVFLDSAAFDRWYATEAEAWEAAVREADRLDRIAAA